MIWYLGRIYISTSVLFIRCGYLCIYIYMHIYIHVWYRHINTNIDIDLNIKILRVYIYISISIYIYISISIYLYIYIYVYIITCNYVYMCVHSGPPLAVACGSLATGRVHSMWAPCPTFGTPSEPAAGCLPRWIWMDLNGSDRFSWNMRLIHSMRLLVWFSWYLWDRSRFFFTFFSKLVSQRHAGCVINNITGWFCCWIPLIWILYCPVCSWG